MDVRDRLRTLIRDDLLAFGLDGSYGSAVGFIIGVAMVSDYTMLKRFGDWVSQDLAPEQANLAFWGWEIVVLCQAAGTGAEIRDLYRRGELDLVLTREQQEKATRDLYGKFGAFLDERLPPSTPPTDDPLRPYARRVDSEAEARRKQQLVTMFGSRFAKEAEERAARYADLPANSMLSRILW